MLTDDRYELFDTDGGNLVGTYPNQEAALDIVRSCVERYGESSITTVALEREDDDGESVVIAIGEDLIRLAFPQGVPVAVAP